MKNIKTIDLVHSYLKYPLPEGFLKELSRELKCINFYPSGGKYETLCQTLAEYSRVKIENILPANGSDEVIEMITRAYPQMILIPTPTFSQYEASAVRGGFSRILVNCLENGQYSIKYSTKQLKKASLVWICNPNNPTGSTIDREVILDILKNTKGMVAVDECNYNYSGESMVDLIHEFPNLIISRSFSKDFGLAGLRLGYMISNPQNITQISTYGQYFRVNRIAEKSAEIVLRYLNYFQEAWEAIKVTRDSFIEQLRDLKFKVFNSKSNFVCIEFKNKDQTKDFWNYLRKNGVFATAAWEDEFSVLKPCFVRICIGEKQEMVRVIEILSAYKYPSYNRTIHD